MQYVRQEGFCNFCLQELTKHVTLWIALIHAQDSNKRICSTNNAHVHELSNFFVKSTRHGPSMPRMPVFNIL